MAEDMGRAHSCVRPVNIQRNMVDMTSRVASSHRSRMDSHILQFWYLHCGHHLNFYIVQLHLTNGSWAFIPWKMLYRITVDDMMILPHSTVQQWVWDMAQTQDQFCLPHEPPQTTLAGVQHIVPTQTKSNCHLLHYNMDPLCSSHLHFHSHTCTWSHVCSSIVFFLITKLTLLKCAHNFEKRVCEAVATHSRVYIQYHFARGGNMVWIFLTFSLRCRHFKWLSVRRMWCEYLQELCSESTVPAGRWCRGSLWEQVQVGEGN